jgi:hypothetical protein
MLPIYKGEVSDMLSMAVMCNYRAVSEPRINSSNYVFGLLFFANYSSAGPLMLIEYCCNNGVRDGWPVYSVGLFSFSAGKAASLIASFSLLGGCV